MPPQNDTYLEALQEVIDQTRSLFHQLKAAAREVHGGDSLAGGRRGVLLNLLKEGPLTVPTMARARPVSRQHIQTLVNALQADGLVRLQENPAHRRSKLVALTEGGRTAIQDMLARERRILESLPRVVGTEDLRTAARVMRETRGLFRGPEWQTVLETGD